MSEPSSPTNEEEGKLTHFKKTSGRTRGSNHSRTFSKPNFDEEQDDITPASSPTASSGQGSSFQPIPENAKPPMLSMPSIPAAVPEGGPAMPSSGPPQLSAQPSIAGGKKLPPGAVSMLAPPTPSSALSGPPPMPATPSVGPPPLTINPGLSGPPAFTPQTPANITTPSSASGPPKLFARQPTITPISGSVQHNQQESLVYKALQNGVATARRNLQEKDKITFSNTSEALLNAIPTFFTPHPPLQQPPRHNEQVFLCSPVGASQKKDFKPRWAVLYRDRLDIYDKFADSKPWKSWPMVSTLIQAHREGNDQHISLTNEKGTQLFLRAEQPSQNNSPNVSKSNIPAPDVETMHRAWLFALKARASNGDYLALCKQQGILHPDERLLTLFDSQYKSPASMHTIALYCPPELYAKLPPLSSSQIGGSGLHQVSKLPYEGAIVDLAGGPFSPDALRTFATLLQEPDYLPIFAIKFEGADIELKATEKILMALATNPSSNLIQVDLSNAKCLDPMIATPTNDDLLTFLANFLTAQHLPRFERLIIKQSNLTTAFMTALILKLGTMTRPITAPLQIIDLSSNKLDDGCIPALIALFNSTESISSSIQHLNLSWNTFTDLSLEQIAHWLTMAKPTTTNFSLVQAQIAPYKPIGLVGLYLQGCSSCTDAGFIKLARSLLWHVKLTTLDLSQCLRLSDAGCAAITQMVQINQSLEKVWFGSHRLNLEGLTALRLFYMYGSASQNPDIFGDSYSQFSLVGLAAEANV